MSARAVQLRRSETRRVVAARNGSVGEALRAGVALLGIALATALLTMAFAVALVAGGAAAQRWLAP